MSQPLYDEEPSWSFIFASAIWQLWKQRNDLIFNNVIQPIERVIHQSVSWVKHYDTTINVVRPRLVSSHTEPTWSKPPYGWFCLNTDGAVSQNNENGSIGGVIRNSDGEWIVGYHRDVRAIKLLNDNDPARSHLSLVGAIASFWLHDWIIRFPRTTWSGNKVINCLTKLPSENHFNMIHYALPPIEVVDSLAFDAATTHQVVGPTL
ncbi:hypothetical protein F3Y22_tig00111996pilonHSYRG00110 [Hibiscus syriacus]|uniref:Uncharacterized protein n=1 Tax=Hibiscus syriacus TaxID=106335 RepID=A0A6A2YCW0_HIBSY|nr:hypothetical protein F3Y22_tig00111996pilonHSYRG00110 [Hibiscus syriacus]